jgi:hypothetical protein
MHYKTSNDSGNTMMEVKLQLRRSKCREETALYATKERVKKAKIDRVLWLLLKETNLESTEAGNRISCFHIILGTLK